MFAHRLRCPSTNLITTIALATQMSLFIECQQQSSHCKRVSTMDGAAVEPRCRIAMQSRPSLKVTLPNRVGTRKRSSFAHYRNADRKINCIGRVASFRSLTISLANFQFPSIFSLSNQCWCLWELVVVVCSLAWGDGIMFSHQRDIDQTNATFSARG